tara:strand:- start:17 stop:322 length:306 start_codon:yes stop_codon:yes gene_type:complete
MVDLPLLGDGLVIVKTLELELSFRIEFMFTIRDSIDVLSFKSSFEFSKLSICGITPRMGKCILLSKISAGLDIGKKLKPLMIAIRHAITKPNKESISTVSI